MLLDGCIGSCDGWMVDGGGGGGDARAMVDFEKDFLLKEKKGKK